MAAAACASLDMSGCSPASSGSASVASVETLMPVEENQSTCVEKFGLGKGEGRGGRAMEGGRQRGRRGGLRLLWGGHCATPRGRDSVLNSS